MTVVAAYTIFFPVGLVTLLWFDEIQYVWLGYELYAVGAMFMYRVGGWGNCGTTEERIAKVLLEKKQVLLEEKETVVLKLETTLHDRVREGYAKVHELLARHTMMNQASPRISVGRGFDSKLNERLSGSDSRGLSSRIRRKTE